MKQPRPKKQPLTSEQMYQGFMLALDQAERLAKEARALARKRLFAGALSKAVLGLEEVGKNRLFLCQAVTTLAGRPVPWKYFWRSYRSHKEKLALAMSWSSIMSPDLVSREDLEAHLQFIDSSAEELDRRKQDTQYVGFDGRRFVTADNAEVKEEAGFLMWFLDSLCAQLRQEYPTDLPLDEFEQQIAEKSCLTRTLGYLDAAKTESRDKMATALVQGNSPILVRDGILPDVAKFEERVKDRYIEIPPRIPSTLSSLNRSHEFLRFYLKIKDKYNYPDWVIVSAIFNIVVNRRLGSHFDGPPSQEEVRRLLAWREGPDDQPLEIDIFVDEASFNLAVDLWLLAFLAALGVKIPDVKLEDRMKVRRVASRYFPVFEFDVEHWPIFHFDNIEKAK